MSKDKKRRSCSVGWFGIQTLLAFFCAFPNARAEWSWDQKEVVATYMGEQVVAVFTFRNAGTNSIAVKEIKFSCSCTDFSFQSTTAKPKETGFLRITLARKMGEGTQELVVFGPAETTPVMLVIQASTNQQSLLPQAKTTSSTRPVTAH